jgi:hypothetical protein
MGLRWPNRQSKRLLPLRIFFDSHRGLVQNVWDSSSSEVGAKIENLGTRLILTQRQMGVKARFV